MRALTAFALVMTPGAALAHTVIPGVGGFTGGLAHPLLVPAHALALVALGLLAGQQQKSGRRVLLALFAAGLLGSLGAIVSAVAVEDGDVAVLTGAALGGLLVAWARLLPVAVTGLLAIALGAAIELDSVPDEIAMQATVVVLTGTLVAAVATVVLVASLAADRPREWQRIAIRIFGSWIAASAILVLAVRLVR